MRRESEKVEPEPEPLLSKQDNLVDISSQPSRNAPQPLPESNLDNKLLLNFSWSTS